MSNCGDFLVQIHMYIDGEPGDYGELFAHLEKCARCKTLFDDYQALSRAVRALPSDIPGTLHTGIMRALSREKARRRRRKIARAALPFAACAVLAAAVFVPRGLKSADINLESSGQAMVRGFAAPAVVGSALPPENGRADETLQEKQTMDEESTGALSGGGLTASQFTLRKFPELTRSAAYAEYILAAGSGDLPDFGADNTWQGESDLHRGMTFWEIENTPDAREKALAALESAGFTAIFDAEGTPSGDPLADKILIVFTQ